MRGASFRCTPRSFGTTVRTGGTSVGSCVALAPPGTCRALHAHGCTPPRPPRRSGVDARPGAERARQNWPRYELIDGQLLVSPAPRPLHQVVVSELLAVLIPHAHRVGRVLTSPADIRLGSKTTTQPDVFVVPTGITHFSGATGTASRACRWRPRWCQKASPATTDSRSTSSTRGVACPSTGWWTPTPRCSRWRGRPTRASSGR